MVSRSSVSSDIETVQKLPGKELDDEHDVDLYYFGARYHDPVIGRFTGVNPMAVKSPGWSPYTYTLNNPLRLVDPTGEFAIALPLLYGLATATVGLVAHTCGYLTNPEYKKSCDSFASSAANVVDNAIDDTVEGIIDLGEKAANVFTRGGKPQQARKPAGNEKARANQEKAEKAKSKQDSKNEKQQQKSDERANRKPDADKERADIVKKIKDYTKERDETNFMENVKPD